MSTTPVCNNIVFTWILSIFCFCCLPKKNVCNNSYVFIHIKCQFEWSLSITWIRHLSHRNKMFLSSFHHKILKKKNKVSLTICGVYCFNTLDRCLEAVYWILHIFFDFYLRAIFIHQTIWKWFYLITSFLCLR